MTRQIKFIYASTPEGVIGNNNSLPWTLKEDLELFKQKTLFGTVLMGSKTYDSLPPSIRPLPNRTSLILSSKPDKYNKYGKVYKDINSAIQSSKEPIWVIGGASVFEQLLSKCTEVHHTEIQLNVTGDTRFNMDISDWLITDDSGLMTSKNGLNYRVRVYKKPDNLFML